MKGDDTDSSDLEMSESHECNALDEISEVDMSDDEGREDAPADQLADQESGPKQNDSDDEGREDAPADQLAVQQSGPKQNDSDNEGK